jgi:hypothetical protein
MNKRIRELAEKSGFFPVPDDTESDWEYRAENARYEKFAELIVAECMSMCDERRAVYFGHRMASDDFIDKNMYAEGETACDAIRYKIKQHFGVEE